MAKKSHRRDPLAGDGDHRKNARDVFKGCPRAVRESMAEYFKMDREDKRNEWRHQNKGGPGDFRR